LDWCLKYQNGIPLRNGQGLVAVVFGYVLTKVTGDQAKLYGRAFDVRGLTREQECMNSVGHRSGHGLVEAG
jgi:hypothetical protein